MTASKAKVADNTTPEVDDFDAAPYIEGADTWEWDVVQKESPIGVTFDTIGDEFIGMFTGKEHITPDKDEPFDLLTFEDSRGKRYSMSPSYKLDRAFAAMPEGTWCRIVYVADIDTGNKQPMKDFRVYAKR